MEMIQQSEFETLAVDIISLYNTLYNTPNYYKISNLEVVSTLQDYNNFGYVLISRACIRNPDADIYDMVVDIQGQPMEALYKLHKELLATLEEEMPSEFKKRNLKLN